MKFTDLINEEADLYDILMKKAKLVWSKLKKGKVTRSDGVSFSYELYDEPQIIISNNEITIFGSVAKMVELTWMPLNSGYMTELIEKKFNNTGIRVILGAPIDENVIKYDGDPLWVKSLNEGLSHQNEESDDLTDEQRKELKTAKTVFKALKDGEVKFNKNFDQKIIKYKLKDPYFLWEYKAGTKKFRCEINNIDIYITDPKLYEEIKDYVHRAEGEMLPMRGVIMERLINPQIRKRFGNFNIDMLLYHANDNFILVEPQTLNESDDNRIDRLNKRAGIVFQALKRGTIDEGPEMPMFSYELSDNISVRKNNGVDVLFTDRVKITELNRQCRLISPGYMSGKIRERFEKFNVVFQHPIITSDDIESKYGENINENEDNIDTKKIKILYKALSKGRFDMEILKNVRYKLSDNYELTIDNGEIVIEPEWLKIYKVVDFAPYTSMMIPFSDDHNPSIAMEIKEKIHNKFENFNLKLGNPPLIVGPRREDNPSEDNDIHSSLPSKNKGGYRLNEDVFIFGKDGFTDKEIKRVKLLYKKFRKGKFNLDEVSTYDYELPEEYHMFKNDNGELCVKIYDPLKNSIKMTTTITRYGEIMVTSPVDGNKHKSLYHWMVSKITQKFDNFNIKFSC